MRATGRDISISLPRSSSINARANINGRRYAGPTSRPGFIEEYLVAIDAYHRMHGV
jgi:hypothetical protein